MPATQDRLVRWALALLVLGSIPFAWWFTVSPAQPEIAGLYSFRRAVFNLAVTAVCLAIVYLLLGRKPVRHKILVLGSQVTAIGLLLFPLEVPALFFGFDYQRVFGAATDATELDVSSRVNRPDPVLIHLHWPNSSFSGNVTGNLVHLGVPRAGRYNVDVRYDRNGFRNDRDLDRADIVVIGDSFVEAAIVARDDTLAAKLESRLKTTTANLGQIAYGLRQELEVLHRFGIPLAPKLVVWVLFGGNDLRDVEFYERQLERFGRPRTPATLEQRLGLRNALVTAGKLAVDAARDITGQPTETALNQSGLFKRADGTTERVYFAPPEETWNSHQWDVAVATLSEADRISRQAGAEFVVVYVPRKYRIYRDHLEVASGHRIAQWKLNDLPDVLGRWCAENGIAYVDTTPLLAQVAARGEHPYFIDDVHWNALGHATAAGAIIDHLAAHRMFPLRVAGDSPR